MADPKLDERMFDSVIEAGQTALKGAMLINGGAATALLAVIAEAFKSKDGLLPSLVPHLSLAWLCFVSGLGLAGLALGCRYFSQHAYSDNAFRRGDRWNTASRASGVSSLLAFFLGSLIAFFAFRTPLLAS